MKALWITDRYPPDKGGVAASCARQTGALSTRLERLDILRLTDSLPAGRAVEEGRGPLFVHRIGAAARPEESLKLLHAAALALLRAHGHDVVQGFYAVPAGYVAVAAAREAGKPSVVSLRGNDIELGMFDGRRLPMLLWTLERADRVVGVSEDLLRRARALTGRTSGLVRVPNGVDTEVFRPEGPAEEPAGGLPRPWLAFSGELRLKKGLPILLELAEALERSGRGSLFWLGEVRGEAARVVEAWRRRSPRAAARAVALAHTGDARRLAALYRSMDAFVFPSLWEGMPNALLETMACAKPVVAAAAGGMAEVIAAGQDGFLVPPERLGDFSAEVLRVLDLPPESLRAVGRAARERMLSRHSIEAERDALLDVYRSLA